LRERVEWWSRGIKQ